MTSGIAGSVLQEGKIVNIADVYTDERFNQEVDKLTGYKTSTMLCAPVHNSEGGVDGVVQVINKAGGVPFDEEDEMLLKAFCGQIAISIYHYLSSGTTKESWDAAMGELKDLEGRLKQSQAHESAIVADHLKKQHLIDIANKMTGKLELAELFTSIMEEVTGLVEADRGTLWLVDCKHKQLVRLCVPLQMPFPLTLVCHSPALLRS